MDVELFRFTMIAVYNAMKNINLYGGKVADMCYVVQLIGLLSLFYQRRRLFYDVVSSIPVHLPRAKCTGVNGYIL